MGNRFVEQIKALSAYTEGTDSYSILTVFADAGIEEDHEVAEAITTIAQEYPYAQAGLGKLLRTIQWLTQSEVALDAAIEAQYFTEIRDGVDSAVACARLGTQYPEIEDRIQRVIAPVRDISEAAALLGMVYDLPMEFGRMGEDLRPRYVLEELLGSGAQGSVYRAVDRRFAPSERRAMVAVKICRFDLDEEDESTYARAINHPHVARALDRGVEAGSPYIVYELVEGVPLDQWVKEHPHASWRERCEMMVKIADGVQAAHTSGVIHRDLKPTNILVRPDGNPVITDFGIACKHEGERSYVYQSEETVLFISPEQYQRTAWGMAPTTDVYSLGGLLYWMMTGAYPNGRTVRQAVGGLEQDARGFDSGAASGSTVGPKRLEAIWKRALTTDTAKRHRSAEQFASDLRAVLRNEPIGWIDTSKGAVFSLFVRRHAAVSAAVAAGLVVLVGSTWTIASIRGQADLRAAKAVIAQQAEQLESTQEFLVNLSGAFKVQGAKMILELPEEGSGAEP